MDEDDSRYEAQRLALSRAAAITGIVATLSFPLAFYARSAAPELTNVPLISSDGRGYYVVALLVTFAVGALIHVLDRDDPPAWRRELKSRGSPPDNPAMFERQRLTSTAWMLPVVAVFASFLFLAIYHRLAYVVLVPLVTAGVVFAARVARFHLLNQCDGATVMARVGQMVLTHGVAFAALTIAYMFKARTLYSGSLMLVVSFLLLLQLTDGIEASPRRRMLYAAVGAVGLAELTWALNYWNISAWFGGALLLTLFFFVASMIRSQLAGGLSQRVIIERAAIAAPLMIALAYLAE